MEWITQPEAWIALLTLTLLEIVLGIDNIIILTILVGKLPKKDKHLARILGLSLAMATRIALLLSIVWIMRLTTPLLTVLDRHITGHDLILLGGGLFLIAKSTLEIHQQIEGNGQEIAPKSSRAGFISVVLQIGLIDIVFSLDSVITAVGLSNHVPVMVIAIITSVIIMMFAAKMIGDFVDEHPTLKMLALSFLIMIGIALIGEGLDFHIPKGYLYFAMAYALGIEVLNIRMRLKHRNAASRR